jgi:hypothetical protein
MAPRTLQVLGLGIPGVVLVYGDISGTPLEDIKNKMVSPLQIKIQQQKIRNTYCLDFGSKQSLQQGCCAKILKMYTPGLKVAIMQYTCNDYFGLV